MLILFFVLFLGFACLALSSAQTPCLPNTFQPSIGASTCESCPTYSTSLANTILVQGCMCDAGYFNQSSLTDPTGMECVQCPAGTTSHEGSTSSSACYCTQSPLMRLDETNTCTCPLVSTLIDGQCVCNNGRYPATDADGLVCAQCVADSFCVGGSMQTCPTSAHSLVGSTGPLDCTCSGGYYRDVNLNCVLCPAGYFCVGNLMDACSAGHFSTVGQSSCTACALGTFSGSAGSSQCTVCPAGARINQTFTSTEGNSIIARAIVPQGSSKLYVMRTPLVSSQGAVLTKWSFYSTSSCTVTPIVMTANIQTGSTGATTFTVSQVGTTRAVNGAGIFTFDFLQGSTFPISLPQPIGSGYSYFKFFAWGFADAACIPYDTATDSSFVLEATWSAATLQASTFPFTTGPAQTWSVSIAYQRTATVMSTTLTGTSSIFNCSCGSTTRQLSDGNCQGLCVDGQYMLHESDTQCTQCSQGSYCTRSVQTSCPTQYSSPSGSSVCYPCAGPDTNSNMQLSMCGLMTCPATTPVAVGATGWYGLGRLTVGLGGDGVVPSTPWYSGYKSIGLVLNAAADRPVSLLQQTLTLSTSQSYALRFKLVCTGSQCGAGFTVTANGAALWTSGYVSRSWVEAATPYFTPTTSEVTIQFKGQMVTSSCTIWLASVEVVNMGQWTYGSISALRLNNGVFLQTRTSAAYSSSQQVVSMNIAAGGYIQQSMIVMSSQAYQLQYWAQGIIRTQFHNGSDWADLKPMPAIDTDALWTQYVWHITPTASTMQLRISGPGTLSPPTISLYVPLSDAPCASCLPNFWCSGATINACPLNTLSPAGSSVQTDCYCRSGYFGQVQLGIEYGYSPCSICPMNFYCEGGNQIMPCPVGTKSQPGVTLSGCTPCAEGEFCENGMVGICPANSYSPSGSNDVADCGCMPGFYGALGQCTACDGNYYCPGGDVRVACTDHGVSPPGATAASQCYCDRGYYGVNNSACIICPENSWCWTGVQTSCPQNTWSPTLSSYQTNCVCNAGYTGPNGGPCTACAQGSFKAVRGTSECTVCTAGTSSVVIGATSNTTCAPCNRGQFNPYPGQATCIACEAGSHAGAYGSLTCSACSPGTWSPATAATCIPCMAGSFSTTTSANSINTCQPCPTGAWSLSGSTSCAYCGECTYWTWPMHISCSMQGTATSYSTVGANMQTQIALVSATTAIVTDGPSLSTLAIATGVVTPLPFVSQESVSYAHIQASRDRSVLYLVQSSVYRISLQDFTLLNEYVVTTPNSVAESTDGTGLWISSANGISLFNPALENQLFIVPYPPDITTEKASVCVHTSFPGYVFVVGKSSSLGGFGFRKLNAATRMWTTITTVLSSINQCTFTPDGNFVVLTTTTGTWLYGMTDFSLVKIITAQINGVVIDPRQTNIIMSRQSIGLVRQQILVQDAHSCGPGLYSSNQALQSAAQCQTCPAGSLCPGGANITTCAPGSYSLQTGLRTQGQCTACSAGYYCLGNTDQSLCPLGSYSLATGLAVSADCSRCPAGFYCTNTTIILGCPANTNSPAGSSDLGDCGCNAGYKCQITKVVHAEVTLPISVTEFAALQQAYRLAVAAAAGVDPSQVVIVSVTSVSSSGNRRLLSDKAFTEVHTSIYNSKHIASPHKALVTLNAHLARTGMQHAGVRISLHSEVQKATRIK